MVLVAHNQSLALPVQEPSHVGDSRRRIVSLAHRLGLPEPVRARLAVIVHEACLNIIRHAGQGQLIVRALEAGAVGIELLALDRGPGMSNIRQCMRDGYSTIGTAGTGLGALQRLADTFDIHSEAGEGTAILLRIYGAKPERRRHDVDLGAVCVPHAFESACGDAWACRRRGSIVELLLVDGLGHGPDAAEAAGRAVAFFEQKPLPATEMLPAMHEALRRTRGAAVAVSHMNLAAQTLRYWCVGNLSGAVIHGGRRQQLASQHGTLGVAMPTLQSFDYPLPGGAALVMHSDGLNTRWRLAGDPLLHRHHPSLIAGLLYRDFRRGRDDVSVLLAKTAR